MGRRSERRARELTYEEYLALFGPLLRRRTGLAPDAYEEGREAAQKIVTRSETRASSGGEEFEQGAEQKPED